MTVNAEETDLSLTYSPLTGETWADLENLFGPHGASSGCWCMWWRLKRADWNREHGEGNRQLFKAIVAEGLPAGVLVYEGGRPVGWCAIAPRSSYHVLEASRVLQRVDDLPVWSITCFFIHRNFRRQGLMTGLIQAAVEYARQNGAEIVEAYPMIPGPGKTTSSSLYPGVYPVFQPLGFAEVARRSPNRPILRYFIEA